MADPKSTPAHAPQQPRLCACGCGDPVLSRNKLARHRRGHWAKSQFGTPEDRFWSAVVKSASCWVWTRSGKMKEWYGSLYVNGRNVNAHRFSYEMHHGPIPDGMCVLHRCDNPKCVNPAHLFLGTQTDNNADKVSKGRQAKGEKSGKNILSEANVRAIHDGRRQGYAVPELSMRFGVSHALIYKILAGKLWKHVKE